MEANSTTNDERDAKVKAMKRRTRRTRKRVQRLVSESGLGREREGRSVIN